MTWIVQNKDLTGKQSNGAHGKGIPNGNALLAQGTISINFSFARGEKAPCQLLNYQVFNGWQRRFTIYLNADYSLSLESQQGDSHSYVKLANVGLHDANELHLSYGWNAPEKLGILTLEDKEHGAIHQVATPAPIPLPVADATAIVAGTNGTVFDERVQSLALSDRMVPFGPNPSIAAGAMVETEDGPRPIERLVIGDRILTKDNSMQPIRWIIYRELPAIGPWAPVKLSAPYFGLHRDITVARSQRVLFTDMDAGINLTQDTAFIEAGNLAAHKGVHPVSSTGSTGYYQVLLDNHECISVSGAWLDSLYVGQIKRAPRIVAASTLSEVPRSILPEHKNYSHPLLHGYERRALLDTLIA